jgi:predicted transglutaminase-like cysteine proteinase
MLNCFSSKNGLGRAVALSAGWFSYGLALGSENSEVTPRLHPDHIAFHQPALAPFGYDKFCLQHQSDCKIHGYAAAPLTKEGLSQINRINENVNRTIVPEAKPADPTATDWQVSPPAGDCNDYAVTKRHELLASGWPSNALLLSEVVLPSGKHHLVLAVHTKTADLVLDNLNTQIRTVGSTDYRWLRAQSPANPNFWLIVTVEDRGRTQ